VLNTISIGTPAPLNPGNPCIGSKIKNGFGTFGQPDIAATLVAVAGKAIREIWYQKWWGAPTPPAGIRRRDRIPGRHHREDHQPLSTGLLTQAVMTWYSDTSR
jgi:hypothetical protein